MKLFRTVVFPAAAVCLAIFSLLYGRTAPPPAIPGMEQVEAEAKRGSYRLIDTDELWALYRSEPGRVLLVDTRQEWEYRAGHIKGALNFPMTPTGWARWRARGPLGEFLGKDRDRTLVFY